MEATLVLEELVESAKLVMELKSKGGRLGLGNVGIDEPKEVGLVIKKVCHLL